MADVLQWVGLVLLTVAAGLVALPFGFAVAGASLLVMGFVTEIGGRRGSGPTGS